MVGVPFEERWRRFDEALVVLRALLRREPPPELTPGPCQPGGIPVWVGSWGSQAGLARVARAGDGWLASAYNTTPERFSAARARLEVALEDRGRDPRSFPSAVATMWTWVTDDRAERDRMLTGVLARCCSAIRTRCAGSSASARSSTVRGCSHTTRAPDAGASTCGRWATSRGSSS